MDGPDGGSYYWGDKDTFIVKNNRKFGGGSLMIHLTVSYDGSIILNEIKGRMDSEKYIELLEKRVLPKKNYIIQKVHLYGNKITQVFMFPKVAENFLRNNI